MHIDTWNLQMFIKAHAVHWNRKHTNKSLQNILTRILSRSKSNYPPRILHSLHNGAHLIRHALLLRLDIAPSRLINTIKTPSDWVITLEKGHFNTITSSTWYSERHKGRTAWNLATWCTMGYSPTLLPIPLLTLGLLSVGLLGLLVSLQQDTPASHGEMQENQD